MAFSNRDEGSSVSRVRPSYRLLTEEQIQDLHNATMEILETVGIRVLNEEGLRLLQDAGCRIKDGNIALISEALVRSCIDSAPSAITIFNRKGQEAMQLTGRNSYFGMGTGPDQHARSGHRRDPHNGVAGRGQRGTRGRCLPGGRLHRINGAAQ